MANLVVRPDRIGDLVLATPVAEALKKVAPSEKVIFLCSRYAEGILRGNPFVDEVISITPETGVGEIVEVIKARGVKRAFVLYPTFKVSVALFLAGVPERYTSGFRWYQYLYTHLVYLRRSKALMKEWEYNLRIVRMAFPQIDIRGFYPKVFPTERALEKAYALLRGLPRPIVLVYPGSGGEKRWPYRYFKMLCSMVERDFTPVVVLGPCEEDLREHFDKWLLPSLELEELVALMYLCDAVVSNNTGPMHIAAALRKPLVQIFDPRRACSPKRWGHEYSTSSILYPPVPPCDRCSPDCEYYDCMDRIEVEWVFKELKRCVEHSGSLL